MNIEKRKKKDLRTGDKILVAIHLLPCDR